MRGRSTAEAPGSMITIGREDNFQKIFKKNQGLK